MANTIKQIGIKDSAGSGYDNRDIGAEAQNVEVSFDANGEIIEDITTPGVTVSETKGVAEVAKDLQDQVDGKTPLAHVDEVASASKLGHVKKGTGINIANDGTASVAYGTAAGTAAQGNDSRLSDARKNPNAVTFSDGKATPTTVAYDGSAAKTISYANVGAAPTNHASSSTTYGVASDSNYGHVKIGTGLSVSNGVASVSYGTAAGTAAQGNDSRLSDARTPKSHIATGTTYGGATATYYGHAKLSDTYNSQVSGGAAANGVAASQNALYNAYNTLNNKLSYVGMIIHSTTLDTMAKVVAQYGGTTWILHSGYVLRGASSGVTKNSATKTGGSDTHTITESELPSHTHSIPALSGTTANDGAHMHTLNIFQHAGGVSSYNGYISTWNYTNNVKLAAETGGAHTHSVTTTASTTGAKGSGSAMSTLNNYKSVYIWERTA